MSTIKTITYDNALQANFVHDSDEILIDATGAQFELYALQSDELMVASVHIGEDADRAAGAVTGTAAGGATRVLSGSEYYYDLTSGVGSSYAFAGDNADFTNKGTVRMKIIPQYTGNPAAAVGLWAIRGLADANSIVATQKSNGDIEMKFYNTSGVLTVTGTISGWSPVAGQEDELEFNIDTTTPTAVEVFVNGVSIGKTNYAVPRTGITDFYVGSETISSDCLIRDVEVFNVVKHTANFASEIPRSIQLYPLESSIAPVETSVSEGFFSIDHSLTVEGDAYVQYAATIDGIHYYPTGGALAVSDLTIAKSVSKDDWNLPANIALLDAALASGADLVMSPVLSSGTGGKYNLLLVSSTMKYDFFSEASDCSTCVLYGFVKDNCEDIVSGTMRVYTKKPIFTQGNTVAFDETVAIRTLDGYFEMELIVPNLPVISGRQDDYYYLDLNWVDSDGKSWKLKGKKLLIPNAASQVMNDTIIQ